MSLPSRGPRRRVLTWQVHGNYLYYLSQVPCDWFLVTQPGYPPGYGGRGPGLPWGDNVFEIPAAELHRAPRFDCVLYQSRRHWDIDRYRCLTPVLRALPSIYLEHDPPQEHPVQTRHFAQDADLLVHVTAFNRLMWDNGAAPTHVIDHAAHLDPALRHTGERSEGLCVVNHLVRRGRRLGADVYEALHGRTPLHLAGMGSDDLPGGLGEIRNRELPATMAAYRYLFNPIRWTSLGLAVVEAMTIGMPVVGLATTELVTVIRNGHNGWLETEPEALLPVMQRLSADRALARRWGEAARHTARTRFSLGRFVEQWCAAIETVIARRA